MLLCVAVSSAVTFTNGRYRMTKDGAFQFDWSGVTFSFGLVCGSGASAVVSFNMSSSQTAALNEGHVFALSSGQQFSATPIEASVAAVFEVSVPLPSSSKEDASLVIDVTKITEALFGIVTLHGVTVSSNCRMTEPPQKKKDASQFSVEFVGDSLTCGYGVLGKSPCKFSASTENVVEGYAGQVAFGSGVIARHSFVSWSGKGVVRNFAGQSGPTMKTLWSLTLANDLNSTADFSLFQPDKVVVVLGANDCSVAPKPEFEAFQAGVNSILDGIEAAYPAVKSIIVGCGPAPIYCCGGYQERVVQLRKDPLVKFVSMVNCWPDMNYPSNYTGCDAHPSVLGASLMSDIISKALISN